MDYGVFKMKIQPANLYQIRQTGLQVLNRELGPIAMIRFLQQYQCGEGDYTKERSQWLDKISLEEILEQVSKQREQKKI